MLEWGVTAPRASATATRCCCPLSGNARIVEKDSSWCAISRCNHRSISALASLWPGFPWQERDRPVDHRQKSVELLGPTRARLLELSLADNAGGASLRFPLVIFMFVKKASDLLLQLRRLARLAHGHGVLEKLPLDGSRKIVPLQEYRRPEALQDALLSL